MGVRHEGEYPAFEAWQDLMDEVEAEESRRIFINHEWICEADDRMAQNFVDALGERTHVAISLRPLSGLVSSYWQEIVKNGVATRPFDEWLHRALAEPPGARVRNKWDRQSDQAGIVERWERLLGPDRVTVIIADKASPRQVPSTLEHLLGLPEGMLDDPDADGAHTNRSLSAPEAELFRRLNVAFIENNMPFSEYALAYRRGAVARVLHRELLGSEQSIQLPTWAADRATEYGQGIADRLERSGVAVVGDLAALHAPVSATVDGDLPSFDTISMDVAVEAIAGTVSAGSGRGAFFGPRRNGAQQPVPIRVSERIHRLPYGPKVVAFGRRLRGST